jgi:hypothetical protein
MWVKKFIVITNIPFIIIIIINIVINIILPLFIFGFKRRKCPVRCVSAVNAILVYGLCLCGDSSGTG